MCILWGARSLDNELVTLTHIHTNITDIYWCLQHFTETSWYFAFYWYSSAFEILWNLNNHWNISNSNFSNREIFSECEDYNIDPEPLSTDHRKTVCKTVVVVRLFITQISNLKNLWFVKNNVTVYHTTVYSPWKFFIHYSYKRPANRLFRGLLKILGVVPCQFGAEEE